MLNTLVEQKVFRPIIQISINIKSISYKWVFVWKCNENYNIKRYKIWFANQGCSQRTSINYTKICSPIINKITFQYLIIPVVSKILDTFLMDVVEVDLYISIHYNIYMKIPKWFKIPTTTNSKPCKIYSIKEQWSFYELKQSNCKRYNGQSKMYPLKKKRYMNNSICICVFIKQSKTDFL